MTDGETIRAAFKGTLGKFSLDAGFTAPAKGVTALFGPSGCGKTTVLRCIAGLLRLPDGLCVVGGDVWQDRDGAFLPTHKRPLGYVFQEASLFAHLSVRRNLMFGAPHSEGDAGRGRIAFDEVVELLSITALLDRAPGKLSGGERQRVAIGRALLSQPKLLLMDEPLSALDSQTRELLLEDFIRLLADGAMGAVYVTHNLEEAVRIADRIVVLSRRPGRVRETVAIPMTRAERGAIEARGKLLALQNELWSLIREQAIDAEREVQHA
jgi:molybdenum ABC transporter ATP-binding protein